VCASTVCDVSAGTTFVKTIPFAPNVNRFVMADGGAWWRIRVQSESWKTNLVIERRDASGALLAETTTAMTPEGLWSPYAVTPMSDGGLALFGNYAPPQQKSFNGAFARLSAAGEVVASAIYLDALHSGGTVIVPVASGFVVGGGPFMNDAQPGWIMRLDAAGKQISVLDLPEKGATTNLGDLVVLEDGGLVALGTTMIGGTWLVRLDASDKVVWKSTFASAYDWTRLVRCGGSVAFGATDKSGFVLRSVTLDGSVAWEVKDAGKGLRALRETATCGFVAAGTNDAEVDVDLRLVGWNAAGKSTFDHAYGTASKDVFRAFVPVDGGYLMLGDDQETYTILVRTDANGVAPSCTKTGK